MSDAFIPALPTARKHTEFRLRSLPGIVFAVLVILLALGNCWVGLYPWGAAVWVRPLVALAGLGGAVCLLKGIRWWRVLLPVWCGLQAWVLATDTSGDWFFQGVTLGGWKEGHSTSVNHLLVTFEESGVDGAGFVLLAMVGAIIAFGLHPPLRGVPLYRRRKTWVGLGLVMVAVVALATWGAFERYARADADAVLELDLPHVPIYYQNELLGRTPLAITPALILAHKLPLNPAGHLKLGSWGWGDCEVLSDGVNSVPLFAGPVWPFAQKLDVFQTPWGERARMSVELEHENLQSGYMYPRADLRNEPVLIITSRDAWPLAAGAPLRLHAVLTNSTSDTYVGRKAELERHCFAWDSRTSSSTPPGPARRSITMPETWNTLSAGARQEADLDFDAPVAAGDYELFCTWFLYENKPDSNQGSGSVYSNILRLVVR